MKQEEKDRYDKFVFKNSKDGHDEFIKNITKKIKDLKSLYQKIEDDYKSIKSKVLGVGKISKIENLANKCLKDSSDIRKSIEFEKKRIQKNIDKTADNIADLEYKKKYYSSNSDRKRAGKYTDLINIEYVKNRIWIKQRKETDNALYNIMTVESSYEELIRRINSSKD